MSPPPEPFTDAQTRGYSARKVADTSGKAVVAVAGIESVASVFREFVSLAKANPIVGVVIAAAATDLMEQMGTIRPSTARFLMACIGTAFGVSVTVDALEVGVSMMDSFNPFHSGGAAPANPSDLIRPSPTTIVENPTPTYPSNAGPPPGALGLASLLPRVAATAA